MAVKFLFWISIGAGLALSACGENGGGTFSFKPIEISPSLVNLVPGEQVQFTAAKRGGPIIGTSPLSWRSTDPSIVTIDSNGLATGVKIGVAGITASNGSQSGTATVGVVGPDPGGADFDLSGKAFYEDKLFDAAGFTGETEPKPIRNAVVNVIAIDGFVPIGSGATDEEGALSFFGLKNDTRRSGVYLQIQSRTAEDHPTQVRILNNLSDRALLALISSPIDDGGGGPFTGLETTATSDSGIGGAFNILDVLSSASELIQRSGPCPSPTGECLPPLSTAYWEPDSSDGTYYDDRLDAIFILGERSDSDEYDDAVVAHEYGHFAMRHFSDDDSLGGEHRISDNAQDIRLSWSEGWGNFFSSAVRNSPLYVDTAGGATFSFEMEGYTSPNFPLPFPHPGSLSARTVYTTSEVAIAGVLWDIYDPAAAVSDLAEGHDRLDLGFGPIWQTVLQMKGAPATMETFWIQFSIINAPFSNDFQAITLERKMELFPDAAEGGETQLSAGENSGQRHTLYLNSVDPVGDEDIVPFDVESGRSYTIETLNLTNGADTLLTIKEGNLVLFENDNFDGAHYRNCTIVFSQSTCPPNDQKALSSSVTFSWTGPSATLNAHVKRAPNAPASAGRLGSYEIRMRNP